MTKQDFSAPAINDANGNCVHCGRDNKGYEGQACSDECSMYWEEIGIRNPEYPEQWPIADRNAAALTRSN